jgi:SAM-dependent methyltransferase
MAQGLLGGEDEDLLEHLDDVVVGVVVVVEENDAVEGSLDFLSGHFEAGDRNDGRSGTGWGVGHGGNRISMPLAGLYDTGQMQIRGTAGQTRNREYDPFARIYNRHWGADYRRQAEPVVARLLLSRLKPGAKVLDVCCGTGQFTRTVGERGFRMEGIDASGEMIRYARRNANGIPFTVADARDFSLGKKFAGAYSVYESLNHVPDVAGLGRVFRRVRAHLTPGAPFLFDLIREEGYLLHWAGWEGMADGESAFVTQSEYDERTKVATCRITTFHPWLRGERAWKREDFIVRQTCHEIPAAHEALRVAGFRGVSLHDARDVGMEAGLGQGRTFFLGIA